MRYGVSVADLHAALAESGVVSSILLNPFLKERPELVKAQRESVLGCFDRIAVFNGPASCDEARCVAFVELLQDLIGPKKIGRPIRCFKEDPKRGWIRA